MNLKELEYVVAIADEKSLTKAAERLFITPSALTQQVLRLENELHAPLFIRSRSGWRPPGRSCSSGRMPTTACRTRSSAALTA